MDISIIIPVFNEEKNIAVIYPEIREVMDRLGRSYEIIFINDGSRDQTLQELKKLRILNPHVKVINFSRNFGQTAAIMAGFKQSKGENVITMDGDLQNDPHDIPVLIDKLSSGFDLVNGWRRARKDDFIFKILPSKLANELISRILGIRLHDHGCTLKAYRHDIIGDLWIYGEMHRFITAVLAWKGARIAEVEVNHRKRRYGKSKYGLGRIVKVLLDLALIAFLFGYSTRPIQFFGRLGLISSALSLFSFFFVIYMKFTRGIDMTGNPLFLFSVLFFLVSVQLICMGFLSEINIRTYYESQNKRTYHIKEVLE